MNAIEKKWTRKIQGELVGRTIREVRYLTAEEAEQSGWSSRPIFIVLDNGTQLVPMMDDEGNDGGAMSTSLNSLPTIPVLR